MLGQTEMNIKSIVEPYENRIKELEELIRKKDFEIAVLKQKIFNINENKSQNINNEQDRINIKFVDENNREVILKCKSIEKTQKVFERYLSDSFFEVSQLNFICNSTIPLPILNLNQNEITNNSIIQVNQKNLMNLIFDYRGILIPITLDGNTSIGIAIIQFLLGINREDLIMLCINNENSISFIYNMTKYNIKDKRSVKSVFPINSKITVVQYGDVIG